MFLGEILTRIQPYQFLTVMHRQVRLPSLTSIEEGREGVAGLTGAMSFSASADGKYLYVPVSDNRLAILSVDQNNSTIETGFISDLNYTFRESDLDSNISVVAHYVDGAGNDENVTCRTIPCYPTQ